MDDLEIAIQTKFQFDDVVRIINIPASGCWHKEYGHLFNKDLYIGGKHLYQSRHFRNRAYTASYSVYPVEMEGYEHDEDRIVSEPHLSFVRKR